MNQGKNVDRELAIWVIYVKGLAPYPTKHIARKHVIVGGESIATLEAETGNTLDEVRIIMKKKGLICIPRDTNDDSVIIESWI